MSDIINRLRKKIPLRTRLRVHNEMMIQSYLIDIGYIPDGYWSDEKEEKYGSFRVLAGKMADKTLNEIKQWEKDGKPKDKNRP